MGDLIRLADHARTRSVVHVEATLRGRRFGRTSTGRRDARRANTAAVSPAVFAVLVARTDSHHSEGMLSRRRHLNICDDVQPISPAAAVGVDQRPMTALNESALNIESLLGQPGLFCKANSAHDPQAIPDENVGMSERLSETEEKMRFIARVRAARIARFDTQNPICTILGLDQSVYKHYENRTPLPYRFIPKFVAATGIDYEWLLTGVGKGPAIADVPKRPKRAMRRSKARAA